MGYRAVAQRFGDWIAHRDYSGACCLLAKEAQRSITPEALKTAVKVPNAPLHRGCLTNRQDKVEDVHVEGSEGGL